MWNARSAALLLLVLCSLLRSSAGLAVHVRKTASRMALVLPFTQHDAQHVLGVLRSWEEEGDPCPQIRHLDARRFIDVVFWFNKELLDPAIEEFANSFTLEARAALSFLSQRACFRHVKFLSAGLSEAEDRYPAGPSNQFYALLLNEVGGFTGRYDYFFLMEQDVRVVRAGWLDALWLECATPPEFFWKGSILRGRRADPNLRARKYSEEWLHVNEWLPHINGNALYRLGSAEFTELVRETKLKYDPNSGWRPYDTSLWTNLVSNYMQPDAWPRYQQYAHRIVHSDFIQNWSEEVTAEVEATIRQYSNSTFFIHGSLHSQGDKKNNPLLALPFKERDERLRAEVEAMRAAEGGAATEDLDPNDPRAWLRERLREKRITGGRAQEGNVPEGPPARRIISVEASGNRT
jgi:hypothetical protein